MEKATKPILLFLLFVFVFCVSFTTGTDFSQDLGRHLKLGQIITETGKVPATNLFSYTNPDFPFLNHHWLSEVIFYLLIFSGGTAALFASKVVLMLTAVGFALRSSLKRSGVLATCFISLFLIPLLLERLDLRPELFGYVLFSALYYILFFQSNRRLLYAVPAIMFVWINIHISFVFGLLLLGLYFLSELRQLKKALPVSVLSFAALLFNPNGLRGVMYPFDIFRNYGYSIVENQNMFFLNSFSLNPFIRYYFMLAPFICLPILVLLAKRKYVLSAVLSIFFVLPFWQIRHLPFFVFASIPAVTYAYRLLADYLMRPAGHAADRLRGILAPVFAATCCFVILFFAMNIPYRIFDRDKSFGYGLPESQKQATDFLLGNKLKGNIFNNFDIGGYAIYRLYPQYRVFVDNRPEAYPSSFFQDIYIRLQTDDRVRKEVFRKYGIHTVFFAHTDMTPWGSEFLTHILQDPQWKAVFLNESVVILTDSGGLADIRNDTGYLNRLEEGTSDYISLLKLAAFFSRIPQQDLANRAFSKAGKLNPSSCAIKKSLYQNGRNTLFFYEAERLRTGSWWCF